MPSRANVEVEVFSSETAPSDNDVSEEKKLEDEDGLLFSCRCESAKSVTTLLNCLRRVALPSPSSSTEYGGSSTDRRGRNKPHLATVFVSPAALTFKVLGHGKQSLASVELQAGLFSEYYVVEKRESVLEEIDDIDENEHGQKQTLSAQKLKIEIYNGGEFGINLTTLLECLHVLGTSSLDQTKLSLSYDTICSELRIELLEDGGMNGGGAILSTCIIPGMSSDDNEEWGASGLAVAFAASPMAARVIVKSKFLKDAITELSDVPGAVTAMVGISPIGLELETVGHSSEAHISLPFAGNHPEAFVSLECNPKKMHSKSYPLHSILSAMRGLEIACETCVTINQKGMIAIQHQVLDSVGKGQPNFVDFIMGSLYQEEEENIQDEEESVNAEREDINDAQIVGGSYAENAENDDQELSSPIINHDGDSLDRDIINTRNTTQPVNRAKVIETNSGKIEAPSIGFIFGKVTESGTSSRLRTKRRRQKGRNLSKHANKSKEPQSSSNLEAHGNNNSNDSDSNFSNSSSKAKVSDTEGYASSMNVSSTVEKTFNESRSGTNMNDPPSSPQLMYGDTRLC